jgi:chromosome segregation ATPase
MTLQLTDDSESSADICGAHAAAHRILPTHRATPVYEIARATRSTHRALKEIEEKCAEIERRIESMQFELQNLVVAEGRCSDEVATLRRSVTAHLTSHQRLVDCLERIESQIQLLLSINQKSNESSGV